MSDLRTTFLGGDVVLGLDGGENGAVSVPAWKFSSTSIVLESSCTRSLKAFDSSTSWCWSQEESVLCSSRCRVCCGGVSVER